MVFEPEHPNILAQVTPWDVDFRQIGPGQLQTTVVQHASPDCQLTGIKMDRCVHQTGAPPDGFLTFGIPASEGIDSWTSEEIGETTLLTFGPRQGFDSRTNEHHTGLVFSIAEDKFVSTLNQIGEDSPERLQSTSLLRPNGQTPRLKQLEAHIKSLLASDVVLWTETLVESLVLELSAVVTDGATERDDRPTKNRRFVLDKALERMRVSEDDIVPISELCRDVGASWRTINRAFHDAFGIGPKAYYTRLRLNRARLELICGGGDISVADAANRYEFWHMGQFAKDYYALFGERPSETVQRVKAQRKPGLRELTPQDV